MGIQVIGSEGETLTIESHSPEETLAFARRLAQALHGGQVVLLIGRLGAGKSVLARGMGEALGASPWRGSPTFALVNEYATSPALYHADLYRLSEGEAAELGLEEYMRPDSILVSEWGDRALKFFKETAGDAIVRIDLVPVGLNDRAIEVRGLSAEQIDRLRELRSV